MEAAKEGRGQDAPARLWHASDALPACTTASHHRTRAAVRRPSKERAERKREKEKSSTRLLGSMRSSGSGASSSFSSSPPSSGGMFMPLTISISISSWTSAGLGTSHYHEIHWRGYPGTTASRGTFQASKVNNVLGVFGALLGSAEGCKLEKERYIIG